MLCYTRDKVLLHMWSTTEHHFKPLALRGTPNLPNKTSEKLRAKEVIAQLLRTLAALPKNLGLIPSTLLAPPLLSMGIVHT